MALPALLMLFSLASGAPDAEGRPPSEFLLHPTGEFSARFMIAAMVISPLRLLFPRSGFWLWMAARRRNFGVSAFAYALFHTALYFIDMGSMKAALGEFFAIGIWTGWLAMFIFLPLALTSNNFSMRWLGRSWKKLQRLVYLAAFATLLHWIYVHNSAAAALAHFAPLGALEAYRLWRHQIDGRRALSAVPASKSN